jgi:hypothetical protein
VSKFNGGFAILSVTLSLVVARSAAAQVAPAPNVVVEPQVEPDPGDTSGDVPAPPEAPAPLPPPAPRAPDDDAIVPFIAASLGVGELWIENSDEQVYGRTVPFELSAGVDLGQNVALFAAGYVARIVFPISDFAQTNTVDIYGAGPGVKVRLTRPNIFIAGSAAISRLHIDHTAWDDQTSRWGVLGRLSVGRQWSVSRSWSLGLAGELTYGRMAWGGTTLPPVPSGYVAKGFSLLFSGAFGGATSESAGAPASEAHAHDGFFLNASVGVGKLWMTGGPGNVDIAGGATMLDLSAGYALTRSLGLFAAFSEVYVPSPPYTNAALADLELHGLGPGARYYLMPFNVFFEGALLISRLGYHNTFPGDGRYGLNQTSDLRPIARATIGWERWIAANWGLGVAGEALFGWLPPHQPSGYDPSPSYKVKGLSLLLSASFN